MRRNDLDYARGIAILLILIGHTNGMSDLTVKLIYSVHVPLFFVICGVLLCYNQTAQKSWSYICSNRLKRIIVPSIIWECILSTFYYIIKDIPVKQLIENSLTLNFNLSVLWFIPCLLLAEMTWILIVKVWKRDVSFYICMCGMFVFSAIAVFVRALFVKRILVALVFIICGYGLEHSRKNLTVDKVISNQLILLIIGIVWGIATMMNVRVDISAGVLGNIVLYYLHSVAGSVAIILVCGMISTQINLLSWVGKNTMGFLVTHVFVRHAIIIIEEKILGYFLGGWALAIPMILVDICVVFVIGRTFPKIFGKNI